MAFASLRSVAAIPALAPAVPATSARERVVVNALSVRVTHEVQFGADVRIVGNGPALGEWDAAMLAAPVPRDCFSARSISPLFSRHLVLP